MLLSNGTVNFSEDIKSIDCKKIVLTKKSKSFSKVTKKDKIVLHYTIGNINGINTIIQDIHVNPCLHKNSNIAVNIIVTIIFINATFGCPLKKSIIICVIEKAT
jgi:hypothetical protein